MSGSAAWIRPRITSRIGAGQLEHDRGRELEDRVRPPADLDHRPEDEAALGRREDRAQLADDLRRPRDRILGEEDRVDRAVPDAVAQRVDDHRAVDPEQAADAVEREAVAELDRREVDRDDHQQREALLVAPGAPDASGSRVVSSPIAVMPIVLNDELEDPGVLLVLRVEEDVAAAGDRAGLDRDPGAVRGLEAEVEIDGAEVAGLERQQRAGPMPWTAPVNGPSLMRTSTSPRVFSPSVPRSTAPRSA